MAAQLESYGDFLDRKKNVPKYRMDIQKWNHNNLDAPANPVNKGARIMSIGPLLSDLKKSIGQPKSEDEKLEEVLSASREREIYSRGKNTFSALNRQREGDVRRRIKDTEKVKANRKAAVKHRSSLHLALIAPSPPISRPLMSSSLRPSTMPNIYGPEQLPANFSDSTVNDGFRTLEKHPSTDAKESKKSQKPSASFTQECMPENAPKPEPKKVTLVGESPNQSDQAPSGQPANAHDELRKTIQRNSSDPVRLHSPDMTAKFSGSVEVLKRSDALTKNLVAPLGVDQKKFNATCKLTADPVALEEKFRATMLVGSRSAQQLHTMKTLKQEKGSLLTLSKPHSLTQLQKTESSGRPKTSPTVGKEPPLMNAKKFRWHWQQIPDIALPPVTGNSEATKDPFSLTVRLADLQLHTENDEYSQLKGPKQSVKFRVEKKIEDSKTDGGEDLFERLEKYKETNKAKQLKLIEDCGHNFLLDNKAFASQYPDLAHTNREEYLMKETSKTLLNAHRRHLQHEEAMKHVLQNSTEARAYKRIRDRTVHAFFVDRIKTHQSFMLKQWLKIAGITTRIKYLLDKYQARQEQLLHNKLERASKAIRRFLMWYVGIKKKKKAASLLVDFLKRIQHDQRMLTIFRKMRYQVVKMQRLWRARADITNAHITLLCLQWSSMETQLSNNEDGFGFSGRPFSGSKSRPFSGLSDSSSRSPTRRSSVALKRASTKVLQSSSFGKSRPGSPDRNSQPGTSERFGTSRAETPQRLSSSRPGSPEKFFARPGSPDTSKRFDDGFGAFQQLTIHEDEEPNHEELPQISRIPSSGMQQILNLDTIDDDSVSTGTLNTTKSRKKTRHSSSVKKKKRKSQLKEQKDIPESIKRPLLWRWLNEHRQQYCNDLAMHDQYDVWPVLVETVRLKSVRDVNILTWEGAPVTLHAFCTNLRRHGRMRSFLVQNIGAEQVPPPPQFRRLLTFDEARNLHKQATNLVLEQRYLSDVEDAHEHNVDEEDAIEDDEL